MVSTSFGKENPISHMSSVYYYLAPRYSSREPAPLHLQVIRSQRPAHHRQPAAAAAAAANDIGPGPLPAVDGRKLPAVDGGNGTARQGLPRLCELYYTFSYFHVRSNPRPTFFTAVIRFASEL